MSWRHLSISGKSHLLLIKFLPNFKSRFLGPSSTDTNCHGDSRQIISSDICPYLSQLLLTQFLPNLLESILQGLIFLDQHLVSPKSKKIWVNQDYFTFYFLSKNCLDPKFLLAKFFGTKVFRTKIYFWIRIFLESNTFLT